MPCCMSRKMCFGWMAICIVPLLVGCGTSDATAPDVQVDLTIAPSPPVVGDANVSLTLKDNKGLPVSGAQVSLEGNMNHAGMKPSFAELVEKDPGQYEGTLDFTMGGDWFILVTARTTGGTIERKIDVPGVKAE